VCGGIDVIKHGISESGKQRYYCKDSTCPGKSFQLEHCYTGCNPGINEYLTNLRYLIVGRENELSDFLWTANMEHLQYFRSIFTADDISFIRNLPEIVYFCVDMIKFTELSQFDSLGEMENLIEVSGIPSFAQDYLWDTLGIKEVSAWS